MVISPQAIKKVLVQQGVKHLYHANTVVTSLSFLRSGGLLSRGYAEDLGVPQTPQESDESDKAYGIYYDIFFDASDVHKQCRNLNYYGPVSFVYSINVLDVPGIIVKITKDNPIRWHVDTPEEERYFVSEDELDIHYSSSEITMHITICDMHSPLCFSDYLEEIVIENPKIDNTRYFDQAYKAILTEVAQQAINVPVRIRECPDDCGCYKKYRESREGYTYHRFKTEI